MSTSCDNLQCVSMARILQWSKQNSPVLAQRLLSQQSRLLFSAATPFLCLGLRHLRHPLSSQSDGDTARAGRPRGEARPVK